MINKKLEAIQETDIEFLRQNSVAEGKSLEYKELLPDNSREAKKEFLADISSFANTAGGDLIFGVKETRGVPTEVPGLDIIDVDKEKARIENLIITGLQPRIQHSLAHLKLQNGKLLIVIRVKQSWIKPHRVIFGGHDKFYARNSIGKYPLDVEELRETFNLSEAVLSRINEFREARLLKVDSNTTWLPFYSGGKLILHFVPLEAFTNKERLTIEELQKLTQAENISHFQPMRAPGWSSAVNFDGIIAYTELSDGLTSSYLQVFRNGIIEAVEGTILNRMIGEKKIIPSSDLERIIIESTRRYFNLLKILNISPPVFMFLSLTGLEGSRMGMKEDYWEPSRDYFIREDSLDLPEIAIEDLDQDPTALLKPLIDLIWNAYGLSASPNFDMEGKWIG